MRKLVCLSLCSRRSCWDFHLKFQTFLISILLLLVPTSFYSILSLGEPYDLTTSKD